jgi:hypothetical protein
MIVRPLTLVQANLFISEWHRHHAPVQGHRFSLGAFKGSDLVGVATVGRPVARGFDPTVVAEVTRLATNGHFNACSFLYSAAARVCREMGFDSIGTYILEEESGASLVAAGWKFSRTTAGGTWNSATRKRRTDQPQQPKEYWKKDFRRS